MVHNRKISIVRVRTIVYVGARGPPKGGPPGALGVQRTPQIPTSLWGRKRTNDTQTDRRLTAAATRQNGTARTIHKRSFRRTRKPLPRAPSSYGDTATNALFLGGYAPKPPHSRASRSVTNRGVIYRGAGQYFLAAHVEINPPALPETTPLRRGSIDEKRPIFKNLLYKKISWSLYRFGKKFS